MTGTLRGKTLTVPNPFIAYSDSWGLLGSWRTFDAMYEAMSKGLKIGFGHTVRKATGYQCRDGEWVAVCEYRVREKVDVT